MSYSTFEYSNLQVRKIDTSNAGNGSGIGGPAKLWKPALRATFNVANTQGEGGNEVSQLYLSYPEGTGEPPKLLRGFERTWINAGQTEKVSMELTLKDLSIW